MAIFNRNCSPKAKFYGHILQFNQLIISLLVNLNDKSKGSFLSDTIKKFMIVLYKYYYWLTV